MDKYLKQYAKKLTVNQINRIVNDNQCDNTLVLRTLLDELINHGRFESLDNQIEYFLQSESVEDFYVSLINSYKKEYGEEFVQNILCLLYVSRDGLSESDIVNILRLPSLLWVQFYSSFKRNLITSGGLIKFSHSYVAETIKTNCLSAKVEENYRRLLCSWFERQQNNRSVREVPYQLAKMGSNDELYKYIGNLKLFSYLFVNDNIMLQKYWNQLRQSDIEKYSFEIYVVNP